jgi:hypothetical protein
MTDRQKRLSTHRIEPSISDPVSHDELQRELRRLRQAVILLASRSHDISRDDAGRIMDLVKEPYER